uniref:Uncharacterized protein n=1 Tax=Lepeophtheirus salmonis TaxID=72036 RepID=A0A0K2UVN1_LEPSM
MPSDVVVYRVEVQKLIKKTSITLHTELLMLLSQEGQLLNFTSLCLYIFDTVYESKDFFFANSS